MRIDRAGIVAAVCVALTLVLAACGGSSGAGNSTSTTSTAPSPGASATGGAGNEAGAGPGAAGSRHDGPASSGGSSSAPSGGGSGSGSAPSGPARKGEQPTTGGKQQARRGGAQRRAQGAAAFLVPQGDNSIPTYGAEASPSELAAATESLSAYLAARANRDWSGACSRLGVQVQKQLELLAGEAGGGGEGCAVAYAKLASRTGTSQLANPLAGALAALRVEGDKAFALFYGPREQQYMVPMVREGGTWKANQIEPIPWPIGSATPGSP